MEIERVRATPRRGEDGLWSGLMRLGRGTPQGLVAHRAEVGPVVGIWIKREPDQPRLVGRFEKERATSGRRNHAEDIQPPAPRKRRSRSIRFGSVEDLDALATGFDAARTLQALQSQRHTDAMNSQLNNLL